MNFEQLFQKIGMLSGDEHNDRAAIIKRITTAADQMS